MPRSPRIALDQEALRALKLWAALIDQEPSTLVSSLILEHVPSEIRRVLGMEPPRAQRPLPSETKKKTRKPLYRNPEVLAIVDEMLKRYPEVTFKDIGDAVGYSRHTIGDYYSDKAKENRSREP